MGSLLPTRGLGTGRETLLASGGMGAGKIAGRTIGHTFDLASHWVAGTTIMNLVGWFGIGPTDPSGAGSDPESQSWSQPEGTTWNSSNPTAYPTNPYASHDPDECANYEGNQHRDIASKLRPLAGIYSSSGRDAESVARLNLHLDMLSTATDPRARVDVISVLVDYLGNTSFALGASQDPPYKDAEDIKYRHYVAMLAAADARGLTSCIVPQYIPNLWATYHSDISPHSAKVAAMTADLVNYMTIADGSPAAFRVAGKLVLDLWPNAISGLTPTEYASILQDARTTLGFDFYTICYTKSADKMAFADAIQCWISVDVYNSAAGAGVTKAYNWQVAKMATVIAALGAHPGRVILNTMSPGFSDWTKQWGDGVEREIPRNKDLILGQAAGSWAGAGGHYLATWDDWNEGSVFEPDALDLGNPLRWITEALATLKSETYVETETQTLINLWVNYGVARGCPASELGSYRIQEPVASNIEAGGIVASGAVPYS